MDSRSGPRLKTLALALAVLSCLALIGAPVAASVASTASTGNATPAGDPDEEFGDPVDPLTECFVGQGYPLSIGDPPTTIDAVVHLSVLTDPQNAGEFGIELSGTTGEDRIVTLAAGVRLDSAGLIATGVNPFAAFDVVYTYELRLPMFDGVIEETAYRDDGSPVGSAAGTVPC
ncbi:DUF7332 family protein [Halorubrum vacuolatum]|uniref:Uncharacterized protein n=1 Tax=Halorubrum vacuolatum TaxID=63740 RepID=A0A238W4B8_HALVU|nr:hypothetical protein [Halorubrum vacuolatum]SNR40559.1 hypothetical protein SAMN06264855_10546 [Halorubrum vacuolatum]